MAVNMVLKEYDGESCECYGCKGEQPIRKGDSVLVYKDEINSPHFCIRCALALAAKNKHRKQPVMYVEYGDLQLHKLSNAFRKRWLQFVDDMRKYGTDAQKRKALAIELQQEFGFETVEVKSERRQKTEAEKLQTKLTRCRTMAKKAERLLKKLTTAQFRVKVTAQENNRLEMEKACEDCTIIKMQMENLVKEIQETVCKKH